MGLARKHRLQEHAAALNENQFAVQTVFFVETDVAGEPEANGYRFVVPGALVAEDGLSYWLQFGIEGGVAVRFPDAGAATPFRVVTTAGLPEVAWPGGFDWEALRPSDGVVATLLAWALVNTVFALKYARHYYLNDDSGIDFKQEQAPAYSDFAYLAFTVGMSYAVSDTEPTTTAIRKTALGHALLSYGFGTIIIAVAINLISNLGQS